MKLILHLLVTVWLLTTAGLAFADQTDPALDPLFSILQSTSDENIAKQAEAKIWGIWTKRGNLKIDRMMALGMQAMSIGAFRQSIALFDRLIVLAPDYAEAWNKRATVYYLIGDFDRSVSDIQKTLLLEPRHFGALSGLGMIYDAIGKPEAAIEVWEKALEINPGMAGLRARVKDLKKELDGLNI